MKFKIGDKVKIINDQESFYNHVGYIKNIYTLYSYKEEVIMYDVMLEWIFVGEDSHINYKVRESSLEIDKQWLRDKKIKGLLD